MDARVIFSRDFREKAEKPLNSYEVGKLRWEKLEELNNRGLLQNVTNRYKLCEAIGMTKEQARSVGYSWACNLIHRKYLAERVIGRDEYGNYKYQYSILKKPSFGATRKFAHRKHSRRTIPDYAKPQQLQLVDAKIINEKVEAKQEIIKKPNDFKLTIEKDGIKFMFEGDFDIEYVMGFVKQLKMI